MEAIKLSWIGSQHAGHSLAIVNNNICSFLKQDDQLDVRTKIPDLELAYVRKVETEQERRMYFLHSPSDVAIVHEWPPDWTKPNCKIWVVMQAWEYGAIPKAWFIPMRYGADEIWVYSSYNKESYIRSGIPASKIRVIPLGVNETVFHSRAEPIHYEHPCFRFLFVGGTIARKGIDVLLQAYLDEFTAADDVCLVIKDAGNDSFYKGLTLKEYILEVMNQSDRPRIEYFDAHLSEKHLAGLYRACDCLVHPYRGEGFGLPIAEAMACGIPAIVPDQGPSRDICTEETAFFIPSKEVFMKDKKIGHLVTVDYPWWLSIEVSELGKMMRFAYENPGLTKRKGQQASRHIVSTFTWKESAAIVSESIKQLFHKKVNH